MNVSTELFTLAKNKDYEVLMKYLLDDPSLIMIWHEQMYTLLHVLAESAPLQIIRQVMGSGEASINEKDKWGETPFCWALDGNNFAVADCLLSEGADIDIQNDHGQFPIHAVSSDGN